MARPLPLPDSQRNATNGTAYARASSSGPLQLHSMGEERARGSEAEIDLPASERASREAAGRMPTAAELADLEHLRNENAQLHALCQELEQALQEAAQQLQPDLEKQLHEYETVLEDKNELIRQLHQQVQEMQAAVEEAEARAGKAQAARPASGKIPREDELLLLSEELERERRQLQEDERTLMEQMREMEVSMARERAEMARQRNDLQRLQNEIRHELERLERDGGVQSKIESLRSKLHDATTRRGASPGSSAHRAVSVSQPTPATRKEGLIGRLFGRGGE
jgi:predicted  nucleic acid-binding Zn-ribbon protein